MMDFENGDFTINQAYIDRVKEIIDYAYNDGMYVIVNDHWDGGWWGMFGSASEETVQKHGIFINQCGHSLLLHTKIMTTILYLKAATRK